MTALALGNVNFPLPLNWLYYIEFKNVRLKYYIDNNRFILKRKSFFTGVCKIPITWFIHICIEAKKEKILLLKLEYKSNEHIL